MKVDDLDRRIIAILQDNSRLSFREIAKLAKVSPVTVLNRIAKLEKHGILRGYTARIDYEKLGYDFQIAIWIAPARGKQESMHKRLSEIKDIASIYVITGDHPLMAVARFDSKQAMQLFLDDLSNDRDILSLKSEFISREGRL